MKVGARSTDFAAVKAAFEEVYESIGISCADIGGLWNDAENDYYTGMEPCVSTVSTLNTASEQSGSNTLAIALGCTFGALFAIAAAMVMYMGSREKQGQPVFKATEEEVEIKDLN